MTGSEGINWIVLISFLVFLAHDQWARGNERECRRRAAWWAARVDVLATLKSARRAAKEHWEERFGLVEAVEDGRKEEVAHDHD